MRNVFDQYFHLENRLTHSLVFSLSEDKRLLRDFVRWVTGKAVSGSARLEIIEQSLPGEREPTENEAEKRGLPDACIYQAEDWVLLIESKVAATLSVDQLLRHQRTASRRGFKNVYLLVLDVGESSLVLPRDTTQKKWSDVYAWLVGRSSQSEWARRAADYFVVVENRMVEEDYLKEGTLTTFSGIPFQDGDPYNYPEAKRLLKLAMEDLRKRPRLKKEVGMDPNGPGRGAITGKDGVAVWDFLRRKGLKQNEIFTSNPHFTLAIEADRVLAIVTVPHGIKPKMRQNLINLGYDGFQELLSSVNVRLLQSLKMAPGASPWVIVVQRRYPSQRAAAILDAKIEYDLRTAVPQKKSLSKVRSQPQWLKATYDALSKKKSNLQVAVGAIFPYRTCVATKDRRIIDHVENVWIACKPMLDVMFRSNGSQG